MLIRLLMVFILVPFVELVLLLRMADETSWLITLTIVILTGILGSVLARREGLAAIGRFRSALAEGRMPGREIQDGLLIAFAAALLLTPGLLTDAVGFALLTPWGRQKIGAFIRNRYASRFELHASGFSSNRSDSETPDGDRHGEPGGSSASPQPRSAGGRSGYTHTPASRSGSDGYTIDSPSFGPRQTS